MKYTRTSDRLRDARLEISGTDDESTWRRLTGRKVEELLSFF